MDITCVAGGCDSLVRNKARRLCVRHYSRWLRHGHLEPTRKSGLFAKFFEPTDTGECWLWKGSFNSHGYGRFGHPAKMAHRLVYEMYRGPIPEGLHLDHLCRTKACVNPAHLEPVTPAVNIQRGLNSYALRYLCRNGLHNISLPDSWYINTYGVKTCLACKRENDRRAEAKRPPRKRGQGR